jgi:hypothetical protein
MFGERGFGGRGYAGLLGWGALGSDALVQKDSADGRQKMSAKYCIYEVLSMAFRGLGIVQR